MNLIAFLNVFSAQKGAADFFQVSFHLIYFKSIIYVLTIIFQGKTVAFSSSVSVELWVRNRVYYVKVTIAKYLISAVFRCLSKTG